MLVARIVTSVAQESPALREICEQLRAAGYEVVVAQSRSGGGAADLVIELDQVPAQEALDAALRLSRKSDIELYVAPGLFTAEAAPEAIAAPAGEHASSPPPPSDIRSDVERGGVTSSTLEELGAAVADGRAGIRDAVSGIRARAAVAWTAFQQRRSEAVQQRRLDRERRDIERDQRRREHEVELQRRAEEKRQLLADRERVAAEQERVLRAQMARDATLRAERERAEREAMAQEAARRAQIAYAEEQERRRLAAIASERPRVLDAERNRAQRDREAQQAAFADSAPQTAHFEVTRTPQSAPASPLLKARPVRPLRRIPSRRERQWQRAAFIASVATLAAMLGFAIAVHLRPSPPLPASLMQNSAEQQVPFGPAKMAPAKPKPQPAAVKTSPAKPNPAKPARRQHVRRAGSSESDIVADDEVIVRHASAAHAQRAQTQHGPAAGVHYYSDEN